MSTIEIVEVGPRDGLQNEKTVIATTDKVALIERLEAAGVKRLETTSYVHPKLVPQMADGEAVMAALSPNPSVTRIGLALNARGLDRALAAGCDEINSVLTASDGFGLKNQGLSQSDQIPMLREMAAVCRDAGKTFSITISVAFGCPFDGEVNPQDVARLAGLAADMGVREVALADTIGVGDPWAVSRLVRLTRDAIGSTPIRVHFHDTRNTGLANAYAAVETGVRILDASIGGLGGCPFAPKATGNIATEDLVFMLHRAGFDTGLDLDALIEISRGFEGPLGRPVPSKLVHAGGFPKQAHKGA
jgi:hydroxymethylglutaryl-CoA lyase